MGQTTGAPTELTSITNADVLIVTALKLEFDAVVKCGLTFPGTTPGWIDNSEGPYRYKTRELYQAKGAQPLRVAVARATEMGEVFAAVCAVRLLDALLPPTLAMCGVCAGREGAVELGDVIATERLYKYDSGSAVSTPKDADEYRVDLLSDVRTYNLHLEWRQALDDFTRDWQTNIPTKERPVPIAEQARWIAGRLADGVGTVREVYGLRERAQKCANWEAALQRLDRLGWLQADWTTLSDEGRKHGLRELSMYPKGRPELRKSALKVGAIATGARVQRDVKLFERLDAVSRRTLGVEMEGAALAAVAEIYERKMIMAKGVMDFADPDKDDTFKKYAAEAAAAFLLAFLLDHAPRAQARPVPPGGKAGPPVPLPEPSAGKGGGKKLKATSAGLANLGKRAQWFVQLASPVTPGRLEDALRCFGGNSSVSVPEQRGRLQKDREYQTYLVESSEVVFAEVLKNFRRGNRRALDGLVLDYLVEKRAPDPEDPRKGNFGWLPRRSGRCVVARVVAASNGWYACEVTVTSLDPKRPLPSFVTMHVHPSLCEDPVRVPNRRDEASYSFVAWGAFTIGVEIIEKDRKKTWLEIDLANSPGVPRGFIEK